MSLPLDSIVCGDAFQVLKGFPETSVDVVMFSPPYWGLRDYKLPPHVFDGSPDCQHEWVDASWKNPNSSGGQGEVYRKWCGEKFIQGHQYADYHERKIDGNSCPKCGAWRGSFGLEPLPQIYIDHLALLCRLLRRVLKPSGSLFINLGDTYFGGGGGNYGEGLDSENTRNGCHTTNFLNRIKENGKWLQPKQLLLIPSRVSIALQEDGWILRNDIIWHKPNHMPSSVKDRLTNSYEHIFHFVKNRRYFYDLDAIREPHKETSTTRASYGYTSQTKRDGYAIKGMFDYQKPLHPLGKNPDDTVTYEGKFDGYGQESEQYGSPRARNERQKQPYQQNNPHTMRQNPKDHIALNPERPNDLSHPLGKNPSDTIETIKERIGDGHSGEATANLYRPHVTHHELGKNPDDFWSITTQPYREAHFATYPESLCIRPIKATCPKNGVVLDPMCGSGTTLLAAFNLGRHYIGIELNPNYVELARKRLGNQCRLDEMKEPKA